MEDIIFELGDFLVVVEKSVVVGIMIENDIVRDTKTIADGRNGNAVRIVTAILHRLLLDQIERRRKRTTKP